MLGKYLIIRNGSKCGYCFIKLDKSFGETKIIKKLKRKKQGHVFKNYACTYNLEILKFFNPELQLKSTNSTIKNNLKNSLNEIKGFKIVITLALKF